MQTVQPPGNQSKSKQQSKVNPFAKALLETGGTQTKTKKTDGLGDHVDGTLHYIADSFFGSSNTSSSPDTTKDSSSNKNPEQNTSFAEAMQKQQKEHATELETEKKKATHLQRHKEMQMTEVFNAEQETTKRLIQEINTELDLLVKEIKLVDNSVKTAVFMEEVDPGTYHVTFFQKLRNFLILMRKRVKESNTWLKMFQGKKAKGRYWKNAKKHGSKYMFGQEGQGLTRQNG